MSNSFSLNFEKQIVIGESTAQEVSFGWLHHTILSKHSKLETCLHNIINSTVWKSLANNVLLNGRNKGFQPHKQNEGRFTPVYPPLLKSTSW